MSDARESFTVEVSIYETNYDGRVVAVECAGCLEFMRLGEHWAELILDEDHVPPRCPECEPEEWTDDEYGRDVLMDGTEFWAMTEDKLATLEVEL